MRRLATESVRLISFGVFSVFVVLLVGATLVVAWPIILIGAVIVAISKGSDAWSDRFGKRSPLAIPTNGAIAAVELERQGASRT